MHTHNQFTQPNADSDLSAVRSRSWFIRTLSCSPCCYEILLVLSTLCSDITKSVPGKSKPGSDGVCRRRRQFNDYCWLGAMLISHVNSAASPSSGWKVLTGDELVRRTDIWIAGVSNGNSLENCWGGCNCCSFTERLIQRWYMFAVCCQTKCFCHWSCVATTGKV